MEALGLIGLGIVMYMHAWNLLRITEAKTTGIIAAVVGVSMVGLVLFKPVAMASKVDPAVMTGALLGIAIYALALAAIGLWDFDTRALGMYSLFFAVAALLYVLYHLNITRNIYLGVADLVVAIPFGLLFFHLAPPFRRLQQLSGWFFLVAAVILGLLGLGHFLNIIDLAATF